MASDKVTVDEPLISTDVDKLIRTVAEQKRVALNELQQTCRIDKKNLDKWIRVLEDEGYVTIEYGLRGTYILWNLGVRPPQHHEQPEVLAPEPAQPEEEPVSLEKLVEEVSEAQEPEPEELLSQYLAKKRDSTTGDYSSARPSTTLDDAEATQAPEPAKEPSMFTLKPVLEDDHPPEVPAFKPSKERVSVDTRELVAAYLDEINKEKTEIERLKKEKDALYRKKLSTLEGRMEADLVALTEAVLEKQGRITSLKERVLELPDKVEDLEKLQDQLNKLREEGRGALGRTREKVDGFLATVEDSKEELNAKIESVQSAIEKEEDRVKELEKAGSSLDSRYEKLRGATDAVKLQIDELTTAMEGLKSDVEHVSELKSEVVATTDSLRELVASHGADLDSLETEMAEIERIDRWVKEYVSDYEKKMEGIERYVERSEDELADLKEAAESHYLQKYLGELQNMADSYHGEFEDALSQEKDIDTKMAESKTRISELIRDSQELARKLGTGLSGKDFEAVRSVVRAKVAKIKRTIEEKEQERMQLVDESRKARKSKSSKSASKSKKKKK